MNERPPRVREVPALERKAAEQQAAFEGALARVVPVKHRAQHLRQRARALKAALTPWEVHLLRRARSGV